VESDLARLPAIHEDDGHFDESATCSFCFKSKKSVAHLVVGPGVAICDECVTLAAEIIDELKGTRESGGS
jgi:hypothetical protein